jgi:hypothetical protein
VVIVGGLAGAALLAGLVFIVKHIHVHIHDEDAWRAKWDAGHWLVTRPDGKTAHVQQQFARTATAAIEWAKRRGDFR